MTTSLPNGCRRACQLAHAHPQRLGDPLQHVPCLGAAVASFVAAPIVAEDAGAGGGLLLAKPFGFSDSLDVFGDGHSSPPVLPRIVFVPRLLLPT